MSYEEVKNQYEVSNIKTHKKFWFIFFGLIFIGIVILLFILFNPKGEEKISEKELIKGASLELGDNDSKSFKFGNEEHGIKIDFVGFDSAGITIFSEPVTFILELNEAKYIDLDNDALYDIKVKLIKIENSTAVISIKKLYLTICEENWNCSKWSDCNEKNQTRVCEDLNSCGTMDDIPYEKRECSEIESAGENYFENGTRKNVINNFSSNLSNGAPNSNLTNKTKSAINNSINVTINDTIIGPAIIDCGSNSDYSCFIEASKNCTMTFWNLSSSSMSSPIVSYEIRGYAEDGRCIYYEKYFTTNQEKICKINRNELTSIFLNMSEGSFSTEYFENAECYPRNNFDCKLGLTQGSLQGMSLYLSNYGGSISTTFSVKGYSDKNKITWRAENSSVIKLEPSFGNSSTISPLAIGETILIINDTAVKSCELKIPFEVYGDEIDSSLN
ncbi:MAG TPA: hypothetical protein PK357_00425 [Candidatus Pacearchaeota archaeon]|nr:hypothetical protein [Candidatus Pacearchaeota archaeon]